MRPERSEEEWDLIEQEANRAKIREFNKALEDSGLPTYDDLKQEVEQLREALRVVRRGLKHIAHRTESTATREDAHQGIIEIADALDGGGGDQ